MPNHVTQNLTITGSNLSAIKEILNDEGFCERIIPMPPEVEDNWYLWRLDNWGTKWDAYHFYVMCDSDDEYVIEYDTAWSICEPVLNKLAAMFPEAKFHLEYADEDYGYNCGILEWEHGELVSSYLPEGGSKEAERLASSVLQWEPEEYEDEDEDE